MTKKIISTLICSWLLVSCADKSAIENNVPDNKVETQIDTLDETVANKIKTMFGAETCKVTRSENIVTIKILSANQFFKEQDASVIALAFYQLSQTNKLKPYDKIKVVLKDNDAFGYIFRFNDFKETSECFETIKNIGDLLYEEKYSELKNYMDPSQSAAEANRAIELFKKADSKFGKIGSFAIISIQFGVVTRVNLKGDRLSNPATYYLLGFNKKTNKVQYIDVQDTNEGLVFYK